MGHMEIAQGDCELPDGRMERLRVLFAGGCHVGGFPIGEKLGFARIAMESLRAEFPSKSIEAKTQLYVDVATADRIVAACREYRPHVLVLQLGHYESSIPLRKRVMKLVRRFRPRPKSPRTDVVRWNPDYDANPDMRFCETWGRKLKSAGKFALDVALRLIGHPGFDPAVLRSQVAQLLRDARAAGVAHIVVLSTFPCVDETITRYRRQENLILCQEADKAGCLFLNLMGISCGVSSKDRRRLFADDRHLGIEGHHAAGVLVAHAMARTLRETPEPDLATALT